MTKKQKAEQKRLDALRKHDNRVNLTQLAQSLRGFYDSDNRIGLLLDEMILDLRAGAPRDEVVADAQAIRTELPEQASAYKVIGQILTELGA